MRYDTNKASAPKMPNLGKDRKHVKNLLKCHKNSAETLRSDAFPFSKGTFARRKKSV